VGRRGIVVYEPPGNLFEHDLGARQIGAGDVVAPLAVVLETFSRRVVGWRVGLHKGRGEAACNTT
jgi:transposase InsO family protein